MDKPTTVKKLGAWTASGQQASFEMRRCAGTISFLKLSTTVVATVAAGSDAVITDQNITEALKLGITLNNGLQPVQERSGHFCNVISGQRLGWTVPVASNTCTAAGATTLKVDVIYPFVDYRRDADKQRDLCIPCSRINQITVAYDNPTYSGGSGGVTFSTTIDVIAVHNPLDNQLGMDHKTMIFQSQSATPTILHGGFKLLDALFLGDVTSFFAAEPTLTFHIGTEPYYQNQYGDDLCEEYARQMPAYTAANQTQKAVYTPLMGAPANYLFTKLPMDQMSLEWSAGASSQYTIILVVVLPDDETHIREANPALADVPSSDLAEVIRPDMPRSRIRGMNNAKLQWVPKKLNKVVGQAYAPVVKAAQVAAGLTKGQKVMKQPYLYKGNGPGPGSVTTR